MSAALSRLGLGQEVQEYFKSDFEENEIGEVVFKYGDGKIETFSIGKHIIPMLVQPWISHKKNLSAISDVYLFESAIEALCFVQFSYSKFKKNFDDSIFVSIGRLPSPQIADWLSDNMKGRMFHFVFPNTILGKVMDCRMTARLDNKTVKISHYNETIFVDFLQRQYSIPETIFSLNEFKVVANYGPKNFRTHKVKEPYRTFQEMISDLGDNTL